MRDFRSADDSPSKAIEQLLRFAVQKEMIGDIDVPFCRNRLLKLFQLDVPYQGDVTVDPDTKVEHLLAPLLDYAVEAGIIPDGTTTQRDLLDAKIMGLLLPMPSQVQEKFERDKKKYGVKEATTRFYELNIHSNYIRMDRIAKNEYWKHSEPYGELEITINLSKPEKNPKEIEQLKLAKSTGYPQCLLCVENVGYEGRLNHPARQNLRVLPLRLNGEQWYFQYSPYLYYNEHSIIFRDEHLPMKLTRDSFLRLLEFVTVFPHYFIGSNADLPIVGGSILSHDHYQAGRHRFPIEDALTMYTLTHREYKGVQASIVRWPMSVVRLTGDKEQVLDAAWSLFEAWKQYSAPELDILAFTEKEGKRIPHNTVTPIVRKKGAQYEMDLVLRNNRCSSQYPDGIFHPHPELHHIKKENIGLIEVMGLAILPGRLKKELEQIADILTEENAPLIEEYPPSHPLSKHAKWIAELRSRHGRVSNKQKAIRLLRGEVGHKFSQVLSDAGVFKQSKEGQQGLLAFMEAACWQA